MRSFVRLLSILALAALVVPASASAKKPTPKAWAAKHKLKGSWKTKDADRDGLKNLKEFRLGTDPRKADSDRDGLKDGDEVTSTNNPLKADSDADGVKDGAEHAGVVTAFDGETITIRQFNGPKLTAQVDGACTDEPVADDSVAGDEESIDDGFVDTTDGDWVVDDLTAEAADVTGEEESLDLAEEDLGCDIADVETGDVLRSAEVEKVDGETIVVALEIA